MLLIALFVVLGLVALSSPRGSRLAAGLVTGALTGAFLSFIVTAQYYRNQSGEYMIRKAFTFNADVILLGLV